MHLIASHRLDAEAVLRDLDAIRSAVVRGQVGRLTVEHRAGVGWDRSSGLADALSIHMKTGFLKHDAISLTVPIRGPVITDGDVPMCIIRDALGTAQSIVLALADPEAREPAGLTAAFRAQGRAAISVNEERLSRTGGTRLGYVGGAIPTIAAFPGLPARARFYDQHVDLPEDAPVVVRLMAQRRGEMRRIVIEAAAIVVDVEDRVAGLVDVVEE